MDLNEMRRMSADERRGKVHQPRGTICAKAWKVERDRTWQVIALGVSIAVISPALFYSSRSHRWPSPAVEWVVKGLTGMVCCVGYHPLLSTISSPGHTRAGGFAIISGLLTSVHNRITFLKAKCYFPGACSTVGLCYSSAMRLRMSCDKLFLLSTSWEWQFWLESFISI